MIRNPYEDDIVISWPELHRDARFLSLLLHEKATRWKGIIAITRGGACDSVELMPCLPLIERTGQLEFACGHLRE